MTEYTLLCERKAAFETNSSSSHSLVIDENSPLLSKEEAIKECVGKDGNINVFLSEWGSDSDDTYELELKLSYLYSFCRELSESKSIEYQKLLTETIEEFTGSTVVIQNPNTVYCYVEDHSDADRLFSKGKEAIRNFLFNPNSYFSCTRD